MPQYTVTDPTSGRKVTLTGDSPPTEAELTEIFAKLPPSVSSAPAEPPQPSGGVEGFAREFWQRANPASWISGLAEAAKRPDLAVLGAIKADPAFLTQAHEAAGKGEYLKAGRKVLSYLSMGLGHELDNQAEMIVSGRNAEAAGAMAGMATQFVAPEMAIKGLVALPRTVRGIQPANPAIAEAVAAGKAAGVPMDAATATDNMAVRAAQHISDRTIGGAGIAGRAAQAQSQGLATMGEQLAAKGHPVAVTAEQAGQGVSDAVLDKLRGHAAEANTAYNTLRAIEADPAHLQTIYPDPIVPKEGARAFAIHENATPDEIFQGAYRDARAQGYKGSIGELRDEFADKMRQAKSLKAESIDSADEYGHAEFLKSIRELGGLKPYERDYVPGQPATKMSGEWDSLRQLFAKDKGATSIFRENGLGADDMAGQLRQDPRWEAILPHDGEALKSMLEDIGGARRNGTAGGPTSDLQHYLKGVGVEPGVPWWEAPKGPVDIPLPVDLRSVKAALKPIHDELMARYPVAQQEASKGLKALQNIVNGPDHAPLSTVDANLGAIKSIARADLPELRSVSQGTAAGAVKQLEAAVQATAEGAGPEAVAALKAGRAATVAKYGAADVLEALRAEPVKAYGQLTAPKDGAIAQLRTVAQQAPGELPKIGRAVLDGLLGKAQAGGGFARADGIFNDWHALGPETKRLLFKDPGYIRDLDNFFLLAKQTAKNANASGTAHTLAIAAQGGELLKALWTLDPNALAYGAASVAGGAGLSKFLHSSAGVRLLSEGLRLPRASEAAQAMWIAKAKKFGAAQGAALASQSATAGQAR